MCRMMRPTPHKQKHGISSPLFLLILNSFLQKMNAVYHIYQHEHLGISESQPSGTHWKQISGGLKQVSVSPQTNSVWGVNRNDDIFIRKGASLSKPEG